MGQALALRNKRVVKPDGKQLLSGFAICEDRVLFNSMRGVNA